MGLLDFAAAHSTYKSYMDVGVRHPYVTIKFKNYEIPLLDAKKGVTDPGNPDSGNYVQPLFLDSFQHQVAATTAGANYMILRILDPSFDYLTDLIFTEIRELDYKGLTVEYGWRGKDDGYFTSAPPIAFYIDDVGIEVFPNRGTMVTLNVVDQSNELFVGSHNASFKDDTPISTVIEQVVRKFAPRMDVEIEPMLTKVGVFKNMEGSSAGQYIKALLQVAAPVTGAAPLFAALMKPPRAASGRSILHIRTVDPKKPQRTYVFGRDKEGEMLAFTPSINLRAMSKIAGSRASAVAIDPLTKSWIRTESTQREDKTAGPKRSVETPQVPTENQESPLPKEMAENASKGARANADTAMWQATATIMGDVGLQPYDTIEIIVLKNPPTGQEVDLASKNAIHWATSGIWTIQQIDHQIEGGQFHSRLTLFRNGGFVGAGEDGTPVSFAFDTGQKNLFTGKFVSRVTPLENRDQLTSPGGTWQL
jgi:hypothetical protein